MAARGDWNIDGKHFRETKSVTMRGSFIRRFFIDGKPVSQTVFNSEFALARKAQQQEAASSP